MYEETHATLLTQSSGTYEAPSPEQADPIRDQYDVYISGCRGESIDDETLVGWAVIVTRNGQQFATSCGAEETPAVRRVELDAALYAMKTIPAGDEPVTVYSSSEFLTGNMNGTRDNKQYGDVIAELRALCGGRPVSFVRRSGNWGDASFERCRLMAERLSRGNC